MSEKKDIKGLVHGLAESLEKISKSSGESGTYIFETSLTPTDITG